MEPAQLFTVFFFLLFAASLRDFGVLSDVSAADSELCSDNEPAETALGMDSVELELSGRNLVGELENGSNPKKVQRLFAFVGLGIEDEIS